MHEESIKEILKKHGVEDEKLSAALSDILDYYYEEIQSKMAYEYKHALIKNGINP